MKKNLSFRFTLIAAVIGLLSWSAWKGVQGGLELGTDLKGGSTLDFKFDFSETQTGARRDLLKEAIGIIQQRIDGFGLKDISITPVGEDRFSVQVSAKDKAVVDSIKSLITVLGKLEFRITLEPGQGGYETYWKRFQEALKKGVPFADARHVAPEDVLATDRFPNGLRWYELSDKAKRRYSNQRLPDGTDGKKANYVLIALDDQEVTGEALQNVAHRRAIEGISAGWVVSFDIKKPWQGNMAALTELPASGDKYMAIILNDKVDSAPILNSMLSSNGQIQGDFSEDDAKGLAAILQAGALRQKPTLVAENTVAAELAGSARDSGILSTLIGFVAVLGLMAFFYMGPGLLANVALLLNLVILVGVLTWFEAVLTLPGIAGVVLTVGMAVDANILVFERIKEEKSKGRTVSQAIDTGYDRALVTIIDANLTTLITAYFLFQIGSGPVRGFGITLAVGIIASMFTALYVTRTFLVWMQRKGWVTEARMRGEFAPPNISWMSFKRKSILVSTILMVGGAVFYEFVPDRHKYDLDFTNGSRMVVRLHEEVPLADMRATIESLGQKDALYADVSARVAAEGIGATVATDAGRSFELRSQNIATQPQIDGFVRELRASLSGKLLPGPLKATLGDGPNGGTQGVLHFADDRVPASLVQEALRQYDAETSVLEDPRVEKIDTAPGAGTSFRVTVNVPPTDTATIAINVKQALANFNRAQAVAYLTEQSEDDNNTEREIAAYKAGLAALQALPDPLPDNFFSETDPFPFADRIDPFTAQEHKAAAQKAVALSIIGIILYVAFRFRSWAFGFAAVVALLHDVIVVLGLVALVNLTGLVEARLNLVTVAAFLTLIGYSINDTIVVFDRIRENRGTGKSRMGEIIDKSINQTLRRTIRTTTTTWIVVAVMMFMNLGANSALGGFAFILFIGVLVGTYSSIFIASPTVIYLPWLWEQCGATVKGVVRRAVPWCIGAAVLLFGVSAYQGHLVGDWSVEGFENVVLSLPVGLLGFFLANFLRFVRLDDAGEAAVAA